MPRHCHDPSSMPSLHSRAQHSTSARLPPEMHPGCTMPIGEGNRATQESMPSAWRSKINVGFPMLSGTQKEIQMTRTKPEIAAEGDTR